MSKQMSLFVRVFIALGILVFSPLLFIGLCIWGVCFGDMDFMKTHKKYGNSSWLVKSLIGLRFIPIVLTLPLWVPIKFAWQESRGILS